MATGVQVWSAFVKCIPKLASLKTTFNNSLLPSSQHLLSFPATWFGFFHKAYILNCKGPSGVLVWNCYKQLENPYLFKSSNSTFLLVFNYMNGHYFHLIFWGWTCSSLKPYLNFNVRIVLTSLSFLPEAWIHGICNFPNSSHLVFWITDSDLNKFTLLNMVFSLLNLASVYGRI